MNEMKAGMKRIITLCIVFCLCLVGYLYYRNQKIQGTYFEEGFQTVVVDPGLLIEEPLLEFEFPDQSNIQFYHITTDWYLPILALYNQNAVQVNALVFLTDEEGSRGQLMIYETEREYPMTVDCEWSILEKTEKAEVKCWRIRQIQSLSNSDTGKRDTCSVCA